MYQELIQLIPYHDITTDVVVLVLVLVGARLFTKGLRLSHFKSDWDKILQDCSVSMHGLKESDF